MKKYQVFVSSTFVDLHIERQAAFDTIIRSNCFPVGMEYFNATDREKWDYIKSLIDECDFLINIVGGRYGSINEITGKSFTQMEYEYANKIGIPTISFLHKNIDEIPSKNIDKEEIKREKLQTFRKQLEEAPIVNYWSNKSELQVHIALSLRHLIDRYPGGGWIKENSNINIFDEKDNVILLDRYFDFSKTNQKIKDSESVDIYGSALAASIPMLLDESMKGKLNTQMRILLMDPSNHAVHCASLRHASDLETMKDDYVKNAQKVNKIVKNSNGKIAYKTVDCLPPYNLFIFNKDKEDGEILVHIAGWKSAATDGRPLFYLSKKSNAEWFNYFIDQFEQLWKDN